MVRLVAAAALLVAGCSKDSSGAASRAGAHAPVPVVVEKVVDGNLTDGWRFLGHVEPALASDIAAAVAGNVMSVAVREGDRADKGDVLLVLDGAKVRAAVAAARARVNGLTTQLELAERQYDRVKDLRYPTVSDTERERFELAAKDIKAQLERERADMRAQEIELSRHRVVAPFSGVVSDRRIDPGAWVAIGQPLLRLVSLGEVEILVDVSADLGARLSNGDAATLVLDGRKTAASIVGVVPALDAETRTMRIRLTPIEPPDWLLPGLAVDVEFALSYQGGGLLVSRDALVMGPTSTRVVKVVDGAAQTVEVEVLVTAEDRALVRGEGLASGDRVVTRGNERLRPGQPVREVE